MSVSPLDDFESFLNATISNELSEEIENIIQSHGSNNKPWLSRSHSDSHSHFYPLTHSHSHSHFYPLTQSHSHSNTLSSSLSGTQNNNNNNSNNSNGSNTNKNNHIIPPVNVSRSKGRKSRSPENHRVTCLPTTKSTTGNTHSNTNTNTKINTITHSDSDHIKDSGEKSNKSNKISVEELKLENVWKELNDLRNLVLDSLSEQNNPKSTLIPNSKKNKYLNMDNQSLDSAISPQIRTYVQKQIKKHDIYISNQLITPIVEQRIRAFERDVFSTNSAFPTKSQLHSNPSSSTKEKKPKSMKENQSFSSDITNADYYLDEVLEACQMRGDLDHVPNNELFPSKSSKFSSSLHNNKAHNSQRANRFQYAKPTLASIAKMRQFCDK
jgi:hypothetical protein